MKLAAAGADLDECWMSFQEYFERLKTAESWGKPMAALLGALDAQRDLGAAAIGGKDSMSGSFEDIHVPPTLISFAAAKGEVKNIASPEFKHVGSYVYRVSVKKDENGRFKGTACRKLSVIVDRFIKNGAITAAYVPERNGAAEALIKMTMGNGIGVKLFTDDIFKPEFGSFMIECPLSFGIEDEDIETELIGVTLDKPVIKLEELPVKHPDTEPVPLERIMAAYDSTLEPIFPVSCDNGPMLEVECSDKPYVKPFGVKTAHPKAVVPVFPGTNCEYETLRAFREAGFTADAVVIRTGSEAALRDSISDFVRAADSSEVLFIPGGFSNGDEPDGSGKFIAAFLTSPACRAAVEALLSRGGLMGGICNGFQALLRTGLLPYGRFTEPSSEMPALTHNVIGRHQSRIVRVRVETSASPWLRNVRAGEIYCVPISHGEGRFVAPEPVIRSLAENGQVITRYVDQNGWPTMDILHNPNGSYAAIEGVCSPDGRIFGKMGHAERIGEGLYRNVPGCYDMRLFNSAFEFFN